MIMDHTARENLAALQSDFLDRLMTRANIKSDAALARELEMSPPVISKLRNGWLPVGSTILIALNEVTEIPIREMKAELGYKVLESKKTK